MVVAQMVHLAETMVSSFSSLCSFYYLDAAVKQITAAVVTSVI